MRRHLQYFESPPDFLDDLGKQEYYGIFGPTLIRMFVNPQLSQTRYELGTALLQMSERYVQDPSLFRLESIKLLQGWLSMFGLASDTEIRDARKGMPIGFADTASKYRAYEGMVRQTGDWKSKGEIIAFMHGAFDPTTIYHSALAASLWPYCDHLLIGFDSNTYLRNRKGMDRPRFPELGWRMLQMASLFSVDAVFVNPYPEVHDPFLRIYDELGVDVLGSDVNSIYYGQYLERMLSRGYVLGFKRGEYHSTDLMQHINDPRVQQRAGISLEDVHQHARDIEALAREAGFLHDFPNGT